MSEKIKRKNTHLIGMDLNQLEDFSEEFGQSRFREDNYSITYIDKKLIQLKI